jgi:hypothetical protein
MKLRKLSLTSLILSLVVVPPFVEATQSKDNSDPLRRYTACKVADDLSFRHLNRVEYPGKYREVGKQGRVSVVDAYRVTFGYADAPYDLVNVKVEQSDPHDYAQDKERVVKELKHLSSTAQATKIEFADKAVLHGYEHYGIDRDVIDVGIVVGTHVLFDDAEHLIITVYFLNHDKKMKKRRFNAIEAYRLFKTDALDGYAECLRKVAKQ